MDLDLDVKKENPTVETTICGEILRNLCGQYTFLCFHCGNVYKFAEDLLKHIETHFIQHKPEAPDSFIESLEIEPISVLKNESSYEVDPIEVETFYDVNMDCKAKSLNVIENAVNDWTHDEDSTSSLNGDSNNKCHVSKKTSDSPSKLISHNKLHAVADVNDVFSCSICKLTRKSKDDLEKHKTIHDPNNPLNCTICYRTYRKPIEFLYHVKIHENLKEYQCSYCELRFNIPRYKVLHESRCRRIGNLENNKKEIPSNGNINVEVLSEIQELETEEHKPENKCTKCEKTFETPYLLAYHQKLHDLIVNGNSFKCPICKMTKNTKDDLEKHGIAHNSANPMVCGICQKLCRRPSYLLVHIQVHENLREFECQYCKLRYNANYHRSIHEKRCPKNETADAENFVCDLCGKTFKAKSQMVNHRGRHNIAKTYKCDICGSGFILKKNLIRHLERGHQQQSYTNRLNCTDVQRKTHKCNICDKICSTKGKLDAHMACHSNLRLHKCTLCDARFNLRSSLRQHMFVHSTEDKPYKCKVCGLKMRLKCNYKRHLMIHERDENTKKPFECHLCEKSYFLNNTLKVHIRSHTGERPYQCSECGLTFVNQSKLTHHTKKKHSTTKPFECDICGRCFTMRYQLGAHMRLEHTQSRNYVCGVCGKCFKATKYLRQHELLHRPEKKQQCRYCDMKFAQRSALKGHEKSRHLIV